MFSGIVREIGKINSIEENEGKKFWVHCYAAQPSAKIGDSLCINGVCMTITEIKKELVQFFATKETLAITNLNHLKTGNLVNIEPSITLTQTLDGHIVYGHIDKTVAIASISNGAKSYIIKLSIENKDRSFLIEKGSVCLEGISLTVYKINESKSSPYLEVMIIPHTYKNTTLHQKKIGDFLNIEFDPIAKYVKRQLSLEKI